MKKIIIIFLLIFSLFLPLWVLAWCEYNDNNEIWTMLEDCLNDLDLVDWSNANIDNWWLQDLINNIVAKIWTYLWLLAVWAIVYGWLLMTLSTWDDEKIKKAKDIIKWALIGFLGVIFASSIILLVVNVMYSLS